MGKGLAFDFMWRDEVSTHVEFKNNKVVYENFTSDVARQAFSDSFTVDKHSLDEFIESRCFSRHNGQCKEILRQLNIQFYDPYTICRQLHGVSTEDFCWIRFDGETLTWNDVMTAYHRDHGEGKMV